jgi:transcriptional regulator
MPLGRPKGIGKSKLDVYQTEIVALLKNGATKTWIARKYGTSRRNLSHWMKQRGIV